MGDYSAMAPTKFETCLPAPGVLRVPRIANYQPNVMALDSMEGKEELKN